MRPILVRNLEIPDTAQGAVSILENKPSDVYFYGHLGSYEPTIDNLKDAGVQIWRYFNALHAHFEASEWIPQCFERFMFDLATQHDFWLRDKAGTLVRFQWYGTGPMYNWCAVPKAARTEIAEFLADSDNVGDLLYFDQFFPRVHQWMFFDRRLRIRDLAQYGALQWMRSIRELLRDLGWPRKRTIRVNGEWNLDRDRILVFYENADTGSHARYLTKTLKRWHAHPGTVLSINGLPGEIHTRKVLDFWLEYGGHLWPENHVTAVHAWELLQQKRRKGAKLYLPKPRARQLEAARQAGWAKAQNADRNREERSDG